MSAGLAEKILVIGPAWVGDTIMAQSLYKDLVAARPDTVIDVVSPAWSLPVLDRMPQVRRAIELPVGHGELKLGLRRRLGRKLRREGYGRAIVLPRSFKSALVPFFARVPVRTGFRAEARFGLVNDMRPMGGELDQTVKRFVALGRPAGAALLENLPRPTLRVDAANQTRLMRALGLAPGGTVVALMPGAEYGPAKRWPVDKVSGLVRRLLSDGLTVLVLGSARDREFTAPLDELASKGGLHHLCGQTSLADAVDLLALARVAVTNDSGLMHMAAAVDTHVVAIYGSSSSVFTPPLTDACDIISLGLSCSPCFARECPLGHTRCLTEITVDQIVGAVKRALAARP